MLTIDYTVPDTTAMFDAEQAAQIYRNLQPNHPPVAQLAAHIDVLLAELRDIRQAHAQAVENYHNLRTGIRQALDADAFN